MVLAALAHFHVPRDECIDLVNVTFDAACRSPDRIAARDSYRELCARFPSR
jgi:hypothetical protein